MEKGRCEPYNSILSNEDCEERSAYAGRTKGKSFKKCLDCSGLNFGLTQDDTIEVAEEVPTKEREKIDEPELLKCSNPDCGKEADLTANMGSKDYFYRKAKLCTPCYNKKYYSEKKEEITERKGTKKEKKAPGIEKLGKRIKEGLESLEKKGSLLHNCRCKVIPVEEEATDKPPLGIKPRSIHLSKRGIEISQACIRYLEVGKRIPSEWLRELEDINLRMNP